MKLQRKLNIVKEWMLTQAQQIHQLRCKVLLLPGTNVQLQDNIVYHPTFLHSLEGVIPINEFHRDGDLLCLQDLIVQIEICHGKAKYLVIFPCWLIKDSAY